MRWVGALALPLLLAISLSGATAPLDSYPDDSLNPAAALSESELPKGLADRDGDGLSDSLQAKIAGMSPGTKIDVVVTFDQPGEYAFICHLPGHEAYGMIGVVEVF